MHFPGKVAKETNIKLNRQVQINSPPRHHFFTFPPSYQASPLQNSSVCASHGGHQSPILNLCFFFVLFSSASVNFRN